MARGNSVETTKLQVTITAAADRLIGEVVTLGIHGSNKSEVGAWIIQTWLWENEAKLRNSGIELKPPVKKG